MITAWRIVKAKFARTAFEGIGSRLAGGRWNSPGASMVYTSANQSLAMLEMLLHLHVRQLLLAYYYFPITFEESLVQKINAADLPKIWRTQRPARSTIQLGDQWFASMKSPILRVPSVILPSEHNYLLNPTHPGFKKITIGPKTKIQFDPRLIKTAPP